MLANRANPVCPHDFSEGPSIGHLYLYYRKCRAEAVWPLSATKVFRMITLCVAGELLKYVPVCKRLHTTVCFSSTSGIRLLDSIESCSRCSTALISIEVIPSP